jgi:hypothetical protein
MNARNYSNAARRGAAALLAASLSAAAVLADPEIQVRLDGQVLSNNQEVVVPDTAEGQTTPLVFVIRNTGGDELHFTGTPFVSLGGGFAEYFSVIQPPLETGDKLSPNGSTAFRVDFAPQHAAERLDTRVFIFTDAAPSVFALTLAGRATGPRLLMKQDGLTIADDGVVIFPDTPLGQSSTVLLEIENAGSAALLLTGPASLSGGAAVQFEITAQPAATTIAPGASTTMEIRYTPAAAVPVTTSLSLPHNENDIFHDLVFNALVQARGLPAAEIEEEDEVVEENVNDNLNEAEDNFNDNQQEYEEEQNDNVNEDAADAGKPDDKELNDDADLAPLGNPCGFGVGFAVPACLLSLCGTRSRRTRSFGGR